MFRVVLVIFCTIILGCTPRQTLNAYQNTAGLDTVPVFVATTGQADGQGGFGSARSQTVSYLRYEISVPPNRSAGKITAASKKIDPDTQFLKVGTDRLHDPAAFRRNLSAKL